MKERREELRGKEELESVWSVRENEGEERLGGVWGVSWKEVEGTGG